ncbi:MAG: hypothetical protein R2788_23925 [Saprospiraceae bacterium]
MNAPTTLIGEKQQSLCSIPQLCPSSPPRQSLLPTMIFNPRRKLCAFLSEKFPVNESSIISAAFPNRKQAVVDAADYPPIWHGAP